MVKDYFTDKTKVFELELDDIFVFDESKEDEYKNIARKISKETGVPEPCIYAGKYAFRVFNWHKIDGEWYYYKSTTDFEFFNELLGVVISRYFGLDTVDYQPSRLSIKQRDDRYGVISKNFCNPDFNYSFLDFNEVDLSCFSQDLSVLTAIKKLCSSDEEYNLLQDAFKKMIVRDLYTGESDRRVANFLFKNDGRGIRLAPLYDYGDSYLNINSANRYMADFCDLDITKENIQVAFQRDEVMQVLLNRMMQADMDSFIKEVSEEHQIIVPDDEKKRFERYDAKIKSLVLENKLIK